MRHYKFLIQKKRDYTLQTSGFEQNIVEKKISDPEYPIFFRENVNSISQNNELGIFFLFGRNN